MWRFDVASKARWVSRVLAPGAACYLTGRLGLLLAIPPGFATAVWPPSGIAFAGLLYLGAGATTQPTTRKRIRSVLAPLAFDAAISI
jgi:hypothetical protein